MMKSKLAIGALLVALSACAGLGGKPVTENEMGIYNIALRDDRTPDVFAYPKTDPDESERLPRAYDDAPPQVPHEVDSMLPVTLKKNECLDCHGKPHLIGQNKKGISPMPESHYVKVNGKLKPWGARYVCNQCHVPQADAKPLVASTFVPTATKGPPPKK